MKVYQEASFSKSHCSLYTSEQHDHKLESKNQYQIGGKYMICMIGTTDVNMGHGC